VKDTDGGIRLQKILSQAGVASRRAAEKLIAEGRVMVNGETVREMGVKADPASDDIRVDGRRVKSAQRQRYLLLYKPSGYVTTRSDPQRRRTVVDLLRGVREYVYPVGRLDYDTEGLLLLTNDGDLAARLTHPRHGVERTYEAHVAGLPDDGALERLRNGIPLDGRRTLPADVVLLSKRAAHAGASPPKLQRRRELHAKAEGRRHETRDRDSVLLITIREGRNRQVRRMCEAVGHPVRKLKRTKIGPIGDRRLKPGEWRDLTDAEIRTLKALASQQAPRAAAPPRRASAR
jgi:23S rRNA pseudouridine2605 synthase